MINAGAILVCSLLKSLVEPEMTLAEKFDYTMNFFKVCISLLKLPFMRNGYSGMDNYMFTFIQHLLPFIFYFK